MKKKKIRNLSINKQRISNLNGKHVAGGDVNPHYTRGCPISAFCPVETLIGCTLPSRDPNCNTVNQPCDSMFCQSEIIICVSIDICTSVHIDYSCGGC